MKFAKFVLCFVVSLSALLSAEKVSAGIVVGDVNLVVQRSATDENREVNFSIASNPVIFRSFPAFDADSQPLASFGVEVSSAGSTRIAHLDGSVNIPFGTLIGDVAIDWLDSGSTRTLNEVFEGMSFGPFSNGQLGYLGVEFTDSDDKTYYGWISYTARPDNQSGTIHQWAYDTTGAPISAGQLVAIPEPSALLLVGSIMGLCALRRRRS